MQALFRDQLHGCAWNLRVRGSRRRSSGGRWGDAFARRCSLRLVFAVAMLNLGWDLWDWHDRAYAEGGRHFYRGAEQPDDIEYGLAEISIINETDRDFLIDSFVLDGWGGPYTHDTSPH